MLYHEISYYIDTMRKRLNFWIFVFEREGVGVLLLAEVVAEDVRYGVDDATCDL